MVKFAYVGGERDENTDFEIKIPVLIHSRSMANEGLLYENQNKMILGFLKFLMQGRSLQKMSRSPLRTTHRQNRGTAVVSSNSFSSYLCLSANNLFKSGHIPVTVDCCYSPDMCKLEVYLGYCSKTLLSWL